MGLYQHCVDTIHQHKKQVFDLGIYTLASIIPTALAVIVNPLIAMNMSPTDYAIVGYYTAFNLLISPFIEFYLLHYYTKRYFELSEDGRKELKAVLVKVLIYFSLINALISLGGLYVYVKLFNVDTEIPFMPYALLSVMTIPLVGLYSLTLTDYRMQRRSKEFFRLSVLSGLLGLCLVILLVVLLKYGAFGKLLAPLLGNLIVFGYCFYNNRQLFKVKLNKLLFLDAIKFCYPLVLASMLSFFATGFDRVILERQGNLAELGFYVVGVQIAGYLSIVSTSINNTFQPDIFESVVHRDFRRCTRIIVVMVGFVSVVALVFIALAPFLVNILTAGRYVASTKYAMIVALSSITSMLYYSLSQVTIALGFTRITLINKIIGSLLCIWMYSMFISKGGAIGAAWGTVISFVLFFIGNVALIGLKMKFKHDKT
ncbi:MAG: polysaccharide biosynthesis C-terminal domain-containing protein [Bacteroidota bacterium]|nr:polysaccharide biosynthesis C-terminal domain-containing protein [Bacteroidota bacterium]